MCVCARNMYKKWKSIYLSSYLSIFAHPTKNMFIHMYIYIFVCPLRSCRLRGKTWKNHSGNRKHPWPLLPFQVNKGSWLILAPVNSQLQITLMIPRPKHRIFFGTAVTFPLRPSSVPHAAQPSESCAGGSQAWSSTSSASFKIDL